MFVSLAFKARFGGGTYNKSTSYNSLSLKSFLSVECDVMERRRSIDLSMPFKGYAGLLCDKLAVIFVVATLVWSKIISAPSEHDDGDNDGEKGSDEFGCTLIDSPC